MWKFKEARNKTEKDLSVINRKINDLSGEASEFFFAIKCIQCILLFMLINLMCLMTFLNFSMCLYLYMDCTLNNFMHFSVHPEQPPVHADQFDVPHDILQLLHVPVLVHEVHLGHCVHGLHPEQLHVLLRESRRTSCPFND
jgi:hypothetical protein